MLSFLAQRMSLLAAALVIFAIAVAAWLASGAGLWLSAVLAASIVVGGLGVLAFVRMIAAIRELYQLVIALRSDLGKLQARCADLSVERDSIDALRTRLALAERRLAVLAIKLDATDELDEAGG
jgi:hypothetical protein